MYQYTWYHPETLYVPVCRTTTTAVHSTVVFCRFRISRPAVPGTRHDATRVSTSTPNENVDHEELQLVLDGCWRRLGNTWVVRVVVLWWCCGIPRCFEVQKGFLGVCMQEISRKGCSPLLSMAQNLALPSTSPKLLIFQKIFSRNIFDNFFGPRQPKYLSKIFLVRNGLTPLFMGAESCEKSESLQTFFATFLMYASYGSKKLLKKFRNFRFRQ